MALTSPWSEAAPPFVSFRLPVFEFLALERFADLDDTDAIEAAAREMPTARQLGLLAFDDQGGLAISELLTDAAALVYRPDFRVSIETAAIPAATVFYGFSRRLASRTLVVTDDEGENAVCEVTLLPSAIADEWIRTRVAETAGDPGAHRLVLSTLTAGERELWWSGTKAAIIEDSTVQYLDGPASLQGVLDSALAGAVQAAV